MRIGPIIGHRGAAMLAPENTIESFATAYDYGCRVVEFDVALSADGELFIFHDDLLRRTTNGSGEIWRMNADYIRSLDAGSWFAPCFKGVKIPTLSETLHWLLEHQMQANIEIKGHLELNQAVTHAVVEQIKKIWPADQALPLVSSFYPEVLSLCRQQFTSLPLGWLLEKWTLGALEQAKALGCVSVHLSRRLVSPKRVAYLKQQGFFVYVYMVNQYSLMAKYRSWGIDGVFTDYPRWNWER